MAPKLSQKDEQIAAIKKEARMWEAQYEADIEALQRSKKFVEGERDRGFKKIVELEAVVGYQGMVIEKTCNCPNNMSKNRPLCSQCVDRLEEALSRADNPSKVLDERDIIMRAEEFSKACRALLGQMRHRTDLSYKDVMEWIERCAKEGDESAAALRAPGQPATPDRGDG